MMGCDVAPDEAVQPAPPGRGAHRVHGVGARGRGVGAPALADLPTQVPRAQGH